MLVLTQAGISLFLPRGASLTIASDLIQTTVMAMATAAFLPNAVRSSWPNRRTQLFWILMSSGMVLWLIYQFIWVYFEVVLGVEVPDPFSGDIVLFLHLVPLMAALALHPHQRHKEEGFRIGTFDFALLLTWWVFLYIYMVIPWQYVQVNEPLYSTNFNLLYLAEKLMIMVILFFVVRNSEGGWRQLYAQLLGAIALYGSASYVANWALMHRRYYSGSIYDMPLIASIAWMAILGRFAYRYDLKETGDAVRSTIGVFVTRLAMLALLSLPLFALESQLAGHAPDSIRTFRTLLSLLTLVVMGGLVFWRQNLLGEQLSRLLESSRSSYRDLQALQDQLIQSEKMASLGRLVGGAAHEINNPLTAMLGYSDLLSATSLPPKEQDLAGRIGEQVRHTKTLVASLLTFARHTQLAKTPVDLNSLVQTAQRLLTLQFDSGMITTRMELGSGLTPILADANQLLHVTLHLATLASRRAKTDSNAILQIHTRREDEVMVLEIEDSGAASGPYALLSGGKRDSPLPALSLSACCRIIDEHGGRILWQRSADGRLAFRVELPTGDERAGHSANLGIAGVIRAATGRS